MPKIGVGRDWCVHDMHACMLCKVDTIATDSVCTVDANNCMHLKSLIVHELLEHRVGLVKEFLRL